MSSSMASSSSGSRKRILLLGSSGNVGSATMAALTQVPGAASNCTITVASRRPDAAKHRAGPQSSNIVVKQADMSKKDTMMPLMKEADAVFIITPGAEDRDAITCTTIDCCAEAKVKFVLLVSIPAVGTPTMFGRQLQKIEDRLRSTKLNYCILRLPLFVDNFLGFKEQVPVSKSLMAPVDGDKPFVLVAVRDVGEVAAKILTNYEQHMNKVYTLTTPSLTYNQIAADFSKALGSKIEYKKVSPEAMEKALSELMPGWQAKGVNELYKLIQDDRMQPQTNCVTTDIERIVGRKPTDMHQWLQANRAAFSFGAA